VCGCAATAAEKERREGVCAVKATEKKRKVSRNKCGFNRAAKREGPALERGSSPRKKRREKGVRAVEREEEVQPHRERRERCRRVSQAEKEKRIERVNVCLWPARVWAVSQREKEGVRKVSRDNRVTK
jgi:hypothetical protein